jgi:hypothetical protein
MERGINRMFRHYRYRHQNNIMKPAAENTTSHYFHGATMTKHTAAPWMPRSNMDIMIVAIFRVPMRTECRPAVGGVTT